MSTSSSTPPPAGPHVFVSHSHQDNDYCREFVAELRRALGDAGTIWYDEHNLGWGALRATIDKQLEITEHFIALLSPAALGSEWVNAEIDAALHLLSTGQLRTLVFVTAQRGMVSPLLQRYKRIERADGLPYAPAEAAARTLPILLSGRVENRVSLPLPSQPIIAPSGEGPVVAEAAPPPLEAVSFLQAEPVIATSPATPPPQPSIPAHPVPPPPSDLSATSEAPPDSVSSDTAAILESEPSSPPEPVPPSQPPSSVVSEIPPATAMQAPAPPPPARESPSIPVPVSGPVETSAASTSTAAQIAVQEEPPVQEMPSVQEMPPAQVELGPTGLRRFWRPLVAILVVVLVVVSIGVLLSKGFLSSGGGGNGAPIVTEYAIPSGLYSDAITRGPDGALWFTEYGAGADQIGRITTAGVITEYPIPSSNNTASDAITSGPDGALWFTEYDFFSSPYVSKIDRITTAGVVTGYLLSSGSEPQGITSGPDGALWFTEPGADQIGRITTAGVITEYPLSSGSSPEGITSGPDGNLWFTDQSGLGQIGRITTAGVVTEYPTITSSSGPRGITRGPDGALWFTESYHEIGRITTGGGHR